ncbi:TetR family transcriptional regulator [Ktedonosporobacter rubrisoli]|uniref:TetR family transcriptional regulator n=1 Tax=Ktedonosporobacter rubrisoli TaxID=2509675 RepID=A0A4P6JYP4_KTERU|nr:TetR/AcrR family transcriptional regulator C-terminal domain-containing protein [Ktedonosporobacter rubrisoli]QBD80834.1 TetR family transcriptional regulator [Ktedonosporobacter rubrisoli]
MGRSGRPKISRELVLDAALALVDRDGIAGLSMRKLGVQLGIEAMTLYYYFPNKDAILDGLIEREAIKALNVPVGPPEEWARWLRGLAVALHEELLRHPRLLPLIATRPAMTPVSLRLVEQIVAGLCATGLSPLHAFQVLNIVTTFVVGHTLAEVGETPGHEDAAPDTAALEGTLDPLEFPFLAAAIADGLGQTEDHRSRFEFALDALFAGMAMLASQKGHDDSSD